MDKSTETQVLFVVGSWIAFSFFAFIETVIHSRKCDSCGVCAGARLVRKKHV